MSWRLRVRHSTRYAYAGVVHASYNEARISPLDTPNQFTLEHRVEVHPAANLFRYRDYWGSRVHCFDLHQPHRELSVVGTSLVETAQRTPVLDETVAWEAIDAPGLTDRFFEYLGHTHITAADDDIRRAASELRGASTPAVALGRLGEWLRARVEYETGTTSVSTTPDSRASQPSRRACRCSRSRPSRRGAPPPGRCRRPRRSRARRPRSSTEASRGRTR